MKKNYKKYKFSDVILASRIHFAPDQAMELGKMLKKQVILLPCEVDDFQKALNTLSYPQLQQVLKLVNKNFVTPKKK